MQMIHEQEEGIKKQKLLEQIDAVNLLFEKKRKEKQKLLDQIDAVHSLFQNRRKAYKKKNVKYILVNRASSKVKYALGRPKPKIDAIQKQKLLNEIKTTLSLLEGNAEHNKNTGI